jgi:Glycosyltransferase 61
MADANLRDALIDFLRRFPAAYRLVRTGRLCCRILVQETLRWLFSSSIRLGPPRTVFRLLDRVRYGVIPGEILKESQPVPVAPKGSLREKTGWNVHTFPPWPIFWAAVKQARLVGGSLALMDHTKNVAIESLSNESGWRTDGSFNYLVLPQPVLLEGCWTSLVSHFAATPGPSPYFHWFMDALPRLGCLEKFPADTRILVPARSARFQRESLELLNLSDRVREAAERHLVVENYYFSSLTAWTGVSNPYAVKFLRDRLLDATSCKHLLRKRVFVIRRAKTRGLKNQDEIADLLLDRGWEVFDLEMLSLRQQIILFQDAVAVCALHGASLTNLLWCRPGTKVLEICASNFVNGCYASYTVTLPLKALREQLAWLHEDRIAHH